VEITSAVSLEQGGLPEMEDPVPGSILQQVVVEEDIALVS
jgi:hypothetical protein